MKLIGIGFGNLVSAGRIISIVSPESAPIKRMIQDARNESRVIDATAGRKTRAVLITDTGHLVLSPLTAETLSVRIQERASAANEEELFSSKDARACCW